MTKKQPHRPQPVKAVFVDMDNTLIETQALYEAAHDDLVAFIYGCGPFEAAEILQTVRDRETALYDVYGYGRGLLPHAFEDTLRHYVPDAQPDEIRKVHGMAQKVYDSVAKVKEGAGEALLRLAARFTVYLVTVGDETVQQPRIDALPFKDLFAKTFIVAAKNTEAYQRILDETGVKAQEATMIGDSLASDIHPAKQIGMGAVYVPAQNWHGREMAGQSVPGDVPVRKTILEAAALLAPQDNKKPAAQLSQRKRTAGGHRPS
jgi:putative hydrolase of the HAD superfamily